MLNYGPSSARRFLYDVAPFERIDALFGEIRPHLLKRMGNNRVVWSVVGFDQPANLNWLDDE